MKRVKVTTGGQISVPAEIRNRWNVKVVEVFDRGDHVVVRPAPDDPIDAFVGIFAGGTPSWELRRQAREEDQEAEDRRSA